MVVVMFRLDCFTAAVVVVVVVFVVVVVVAVSSSLPVLLSLPFNFVVSRAFF